jgi:hypothetical protein
MAKRYNNAFCLFYVVVCTGLLAGANFPMGLPFMRAFRVLLTEYLALR